MTVIFDSDILKSEKDIICAIIWIVILFFSGCGSKTEETRSGENSTEAIKNTEAQIAETEPTEAPTTETEPILERSFTYDLSIMDFFYVIPAWNDEQCWIQKDNDGKAMRIELEEDLTVCYIPGKWRDCQN